MKLYNFRELLIKKAGPELENLLRLIHEDVLVDLAFESLEKMADNKGTKANSAITSFAGSMDDVGANMLHDALGHHVSKYKAALNAGNREAADKHLERTVHLADFASKASKHSHGKLEFEHVPMNAWEMNYTGDAKRVDKNGRTKYVQDQKGTGRRLPATKREGTMFPDYRYLEQSPHESYKHPSRLRGHTGSYPLEEMKINGKHIVVDPDAAHGGSYEEHEFDKHPIFAGETNARGDTKPTWEHSEKYRTDDHRSKFADSLHKWDTESEHMDNWLDRHEAMEEADPEGYAARGSEMSKPAMDGVSKEPKELDVDKIPEHLRHLLGDDESSQESQLVEEPAKESEELDVDKIPEHLRHLLKSNGNYDEDLEGLSVFNPDDETADDEADQWLKEAEEKKSTPAKSKSKKKGSSHVDDMTSDELTAHKDMARHWMNAANQHRKQSADAKKNPVLFAEGHRDAAHNKAHADYNDALQALRSSDEYKGMSSTKKMRAERKFKKDWLTDNPDHHSDTASSVAEAHGMHDKADEISRTNKQKQKDHIMMGAPSAAPGETMSQEEAIQHAGGSRTEEGASSVGSGASVESAFAHANKDFIEAQRQKHGTPEYGEEEYSEDLENPDKTVHRHHSLSTPESQGMVNKMFKEYGGLIGDNVNYAKKYLKSVGIPDSTIDEGDLHEAGMLGLMSALRDFEPESGHKFHSYAGQRMQGMMRSHIGSKDPIPADMRAQLNVFRKQQRAVQPEETSEAVSTPEQATPEAPPAQEAPKPSKLDTSIMDDGQKDRLNRVRSARMAYKPKGE